MLAYADTLLHRYNNQHIRGDAHIEETATSAQAAGPYREHAEIALLLGGNRHTQASCVKRKKKKREREKRTRTRTIAIDVGEMVVVGGKGSLGKLAGEFGGLWPAGAEWLWAFLFWTALAGLPAETSALRARGCAIVLVSRPPSAQHGRCR